MALTDAGFAQRFSEDGKPYYTVFLCEDSQWGYCETIFETKPSHRYKLVWTGPRDLTVVTDDGSVTLAAQAESVADIRFSNTVPENAAASVELNASKCVEMPPIIGTDVKPPPVPSRQSK